MGQSDKNLLWTLTITSPLLRVETQTNNELLEAYEIELDINHPDNDPEVSKTGCQGLQGRKAPTLASTNSLDKLARQ